MTPPDHAPRPATSPVAAPLQRLPPKAFSSEVETGSREENASNKKSRAQALILSEPELL